MLDKLSINNIALIKSQVIEFSKGLNVLTGETGAGKSLVVDALSLLLGEKADKSLISYGEKTASVEAVFSSVSPLVKETLKELVGEEDDEIIISRRLSLDGRNEIRVNGNIFTLGMLKKLSSPLLDLHGQFEHQNLLKVQSHIKILDTFGGKEIVKCKDAYLSALKKYDDVITELDSFNGDDLERNRLVDLYKYQIDEIDEASFYEGEEEELKAFRNQVLHQEKILEAINGAMKLTSGDGYEYQGAVETIKKAGILLSGVAQYCEDLNPLVERLEASRLEIDDISSTLDDLLGKLFIDEEKAKINENRLDLLSSFKKKYGSSIEEINEYRTRVGNEYERLVNASERIEQLKVLREKYKDELLQDAKLLTEARKLCAKEFERQIKEELKDLGMKSASFVVSFEPIDIEQRTSAGLDRIEFMFSANLGGELKPLKAVASGGEMSRFMLAVKNITAKIEGIQTLVFDEIDTGVSGVMALTLAQKLKAVSKVSQVICVTHLPQIASFADNHFVIEKVENNNTTTTSVAKVKGEKRVEEIARLISGSLTEHSLSHAKELLESASKF